MKNALLKTATLTISSGHTQTICNGLFDDGSQGTLITRELFESLKLKVIGKFKIDISGFASYAR